MGLARLRRAPRELLPDRDQVRLRSGRLAGLSKTGQSSEPAEGPSRLTSFFTLSGLCAPPALRGESDLRLPRRVVRSGASWSGGRPQGGESCPLAVGAENPKALGRASRQGPVCRAVALRGARACCSLPEHPQTPRQPELGKPPTPQCWRRRLLWLRQGTRKTGVKPYGRRWAKSSPIPRGLFPSARQPVAWGPFPPEPSARCPRPSQAVPQSAPDPSPSLARGKARRSAGPGSQRRRGKD